jgi:hypothetical protein
MNLSTATPDQLLFSPFGPDVLPVEAPMRPIACFAEFDEPSTKNWIFCIIYLLGFGATGAVGAYLYLKRKNGHKINRSDSLRTSYHKEIP